MTTEAVLAPGAAQVARLVRRSGPYSLRDQGAHGTLEALAADAVAWRCSRDEQPIPQGVEKPQGRSGPGVEPVPVDVLQAQRVILDGLDEAALATYVPDLVRAFAERPEDTEHLSTEPLDAVLLTALLARTRAGTVDAPVVYDPACGTAGTLIGAAQALRGLGGSPLVHGQDVNAWAAYVAACALVVGGTPGEITRGNSLALDLHPDFRYDFAVAEPPYGLEWRGIEAAVREQHRAGLYPGGLPALSDGSLLFVQRLIEKMRPAADGGGRAVILLAPGSLRAGGPGGDAIRRWLLDEDLLEAVIGLPEGISAATGIRLNALVLTNVRPKARQRKIQVVDLRGSFESTGTSRLYRRRLRSDALDTLRNTLSTVKDGPNSRTVTAARFMQRVVTVASGSSPAARRTWRLPLSMAEDPVAFLNRNVHVPQSEPVDLGEGSAVCRIEVDAVLNRDAGTVGSWIKERRWLATRAAAVATETAYVAAASSEDRAATGQAIPPGPRVMLPIEPHWLAVAGDASTGAPSGRFVSFRLDEGLSPEFVVGFLNSRMGVLARRVALGPLGGAGAPRTVSRSALDAFLAALVLPVPDAVVQQQISETAAAVEAAAARVQRTADDLWRTPERHMELLRQVPRPPQQQTLAEWAQELPYPLATALWACEALRGNRHAAHRQLFLFWEATAMFTGTVLLSALDQDSGLRETEMESLRAALSNQNLSMQRSTLGVWLVVTQRLGKRFRDMLDSDDPDERARVEALFARAPDELLRALCSADLAAVLGRVVKRRNDWSGHGGATTDAVLDERNRWLVEQIEALRDIIDGTWAGAPLVRAGTASYEDGMFVYEVEIVMGLNTPFLTRTVTVGSPMTRGELYIVTDGAQRALGIEPFVQLRASPTSVQFACYFYNRLVGDEARLVSYHLGGEGEGEVLERVPGLSILVAGFDPAVKGDQLK